MTFKLGLPQTIYLILSLIGLVSPMLQKGEKPKPYQIFAEIVGFLVSLGLLYWGGFFLKN